LAAASEEPDDAAAEGWLRAASDFDPDAFDPPLFPPLLPPDFDDPPLR